MKRDCGKGELIPIKWSVIWCIGQSDKEHEKYFPDNESALAFYGEKQREIEAIPYSNVRLYVEDKQGYANCLSGFTVLANGGHNCFERVE